jgi:HlyD family secretion protein
MGHLGSGFLGMRRHWVGLPERRSPALPVLLALAVGLGAVAGAVSDRFVSPAQIAAKAAPPSPSVITARMWFGVLPQVVQLRADVNAGQMVAVGAPSDLDGSLPVVTSVAVAVGQRVAAGQLLVTVAERPVFVFAGIIPAFRTMMPGMAGPDVAELQAGLAAAGFATGADPSGVYGPGTSAAVSALYKASGVSTVMSPQAGQVPGLSAQAGAARSALSAAQAKLGSDQQSAAPPHVLTADRAEVAAANSRLAAAEGALAAAQRLAGPVVPLGEVAFVPRLPETVQSVDQLGATVRSSVAQLVSGEVTLTASGSPAQVSLLRAGMKATAVSDVSGTDFPVRITSVRGSQVVLVPAAQLPSGMAGQNVQVTVTTSEVKALIVPIAAVSTSASGQTFVTVSTPSGTMRVPVRLALASGGEQAVSPLRRGALRSGDLVVLGIGAAGGGGA